MTDHPFAELPTPTGPGVVLHRREAYDHVPDSIAAARNQARDFLAELAGRRGTAISDRAVGDVLLVVSELVTNAERHDGGPRLIDLTCTGQDLEVTVWDTSTAMPVRVPPDPTRVGGHGIEIVARLCTLLHTERVPGGKGVHARYHLT